MSDENLFEIAILFRDETSYVFQEQIVVFFTSINQEPLPATPDSKAIGSAKNSRIQVFSWNQPNCSLFV